MKQVYKVEVLRVCGRGEFTVEMEAPSMGPEGKMIPGESGDEAVSRVINGLLKNPEEARSLFDALQRKVVNGEVVCTVEFTVGRVSLLSGA